MSLHVLMTADTYGGVWTYAVDLARGLAPCRVTLAAMGGPLSAAQREQARQVANLGVREGAFRLEWMDDPWEDVARAGEWLIALDREVRPDVVHLNGYAHASLEWRSPVLVVGHSCVLSWWRAVKGVDAPPRFQRYREAVRQGLQAADMVVAPTAAMLDELARDYGPFRASCVIHNGRYPKPFAASVKERLIFTAGRLWDDAKNIALLDEVAPTLPWPVYAAGDNRCPDGRQRSLDSVRALGLSGPVEVAAWLSRAAIYALPARYEPFGLSAVEAALSGCALVLADIPSLREVWAEAAVFAPVDQPQAWRRTLLELIGDDDLRQKMAARAAARARRYSAREMATGYLSAYSLLGKSAYAA